MNNKEPISCVKAHKVEGEHSNVLPQSWCVERETPDGFSGIMSCYDIVNGVASVGIWDGKDHVWHVPFDLETCKDIYQLFKDQQVIFKDGKIVLA